MCVVYDLLRDYFFGWSVFIFGEIWFILEKGTLDFRPQYHIYHKLNF